MEKSTEPNESLEEKGIKEASEINAAQEEKKSESTTPDLPKNDTIVTKIDFDKLELEDYSAVLKKMIHSDQWIKRGKDNHYVVKRLKNADSILTDSTISLLKKEGAKQIPNSVIIFKMGCNKLLRV